MFFVRRFYDSGYSARVGFQFFQRDAAWLKLVAVGCLDVAVPEFIAEPQTLRQLENNPSIGAPFSERFNHRRTILQMRFTTLTVFKRRRRGKTHLQYRAA